MNRVFVQLIVCVLTYTVVKSQGLKQRRCMRCFDVAADGTAWALADSGSAEALGHMFQQDNQEDVARFDKKESGLKIRNCPVFENMTTDTAGSLDVVDCDNNCTTLYLTVTVTMNYETNYEEQKFFNASYDLIQLIMGCGLDTKNQSVRTCEMFENNTRTTEVEGENFGTSLTMMAKGCRVEECNTDLCNYN
ncbi:hypothetical protein ACHWQZ_G015550 [Mnemiopsis leidyi]